MVATMQNMARCGREEGVMFQFAVRVMFFSSKRFLWREMFLMQRQPQTTCGYSLCCFRRGLGVTNSCVQNRFYSDAFTAARCWRSRKDVQAKAIFWQTTLMVTLASAHKLRCYLHNTFLIWKLELGFLCFKLRCQIVVILLPLSVPCSLSTPPPR